MPTPSPWPFHHPLHPEMLGLHHFRRFGLEGAIYDHARLFALARLVLLVLWVLFAVAAANVAAQRGQPRLPWLAVGLALGPLALLGALIAPYSPERQALPKNNTRPSPSEPPPSETIRIDVD